MRERERGNKIHERKRARDNREGEGERKGGGGGGGERERGEVPTMVTLHDIRFVECG